jgi:TonB family protein
MESLLKYEVISAICICLFYIFYLFFLKNETFFSINRKLILLLITFSLLVPAIKLELKNPFIHNQQSYYTIQNNLENTLPNKDTNNNLAIINNSGKSYQTKSLDYIEILSYLYLLGIWFNIFILFYNIIKLLKLKRKSKTVFIAGKKCFIVPDKYGSFSFFNMVFLSENLIENNNVIEIFKHELIHIKENHTFDLFTISLIKAFQWFNPFIYLFEKELKAVHEYISDQKVINYDEEIKNNYDYINLLLNQTIGAQFSELTNNFNSKLIKRRIKMLMKTKSRKIRLWRYCIFIFPIAISLIAFSCNKPTETKTYTLKYPPLSHTEKQPKFDYMGEPIMGWQEYRELVKSIQRMPDEAKKNNITAEIMIAFTVNEDGSMSNIRYGCGKIAGHTWSNNGIGYGLDDEAFRITKILSEKVKWKPATYLDNPIKLTEYVYFDFGDREVWDMFTAGSASEYHDGKTGFNYSFTNPCNVSDDTKPSFFTSKHFSQLYHNIKYPKKAIETKKSGKVIISFEVNEQGLTKNSRVEKSAGYGFDEEALRVVRELKDLYTKGFNHEGKRYNITIEFDSKLNYDYSIDLQGYRWQIIYPSEKPVVEESYLQFLKKRDEL